VSSLQVVDQASVARRNRALVLQALRSAGPTSRTELVRRTPLTKATISVIVDELVRDGLVRELGAVAPSGPGRPVQMLEYDARAHAVAGVHVGVTTVHVVLADGSADRLAEVRFPTPAGDAEAVLTAIGTRVRDLAVDHGQESLHGIGVCIPGRVDTDTGWCHRAPNLHWVDVDVAGVVSDAAGAPVFVVNDAQAALIAEHESGAGAGCDEMLVLYAGDGVSAAVLTKGELFTGATGASGEIGHCPVDGARRRCGCGRVGCLETEASTQAVLHSVRSALADGRPSTIKRGSRLALTRVLEAARAGDEVCLNAVRAAGTRLGEAAGVLINLFNPRLVVLAGELSVAGEDMLDPLRRTASRVALPDSWEDSEFRVATFAEDAEVVGAVAVALRRIDPLSLAPRLAPA
jgi:predicted NBD/HSP70 family sugar kinase